MTKSTSDPEFHPLTEIDQIIHTPARLRLLTYLCVVRSADCLLLVRVTGLTRGHLATHLTKLEEAA